MKYHDLARLSSVLFVSYRCVIVSFVIILVNLNNNSVNSIIRPILCILLVAREVKHDK